ncbi:phage tail tape measure protein [Shinella sp. JR1-6]|uniref:phage tail tape measure protein n=1 Tax=Shinella sp. JR1-6 TaxID=2527671 RepID=UPI00102D56DA|nr:phage tail tape measure protein [Shinella sp. JR1-6]TAA55283.1 phage tail tape measure protein [Shinella sp. JR1-6]
MAQLSSVLKLTLLDQVTGPVRRVSGAISALDRQQTAMMAPLRGFGAQMLAFGAGYVGVSKGIGSTIGAAMDFESAFADVKKVVNASDAQFEVMSRSIRKMSTELPMASTEIAALFAAAGESGIATNELQAFAEMASRVGIAFDMTAADAGESLAKLKTQFGLTVAETGDLADAVNHLSNNMASKSSEITTFLLKVGSLSEMAGFAKEEVAALGSAMIAAGAQPEVAATAMQNVAKKMTAGVLAKKEQRDVAKALGLDLPTLSKEMQKDAPGAVKKVLKAISKQSKDKHISLLSGFFGDEAKAFAPLIANTELMDKALDSVADKSKYTGSAFREFTARADTTANALQILRNKIGYVFEDIGLSWLPSLKGGIAEFGHVMDTLGSRFTIFDEFQSRIGGFLSGLGATDGSDALKGIRDFIFGAEDADGAADKYGRLFGQFQEYGKSIREFGKEVRDNPVVKFLSDLSPYYLEALKWTIGFALVAGAIRKLAGAMMLLSGASTVLAALKGLGGIYDALSGDGVDLPDRDGKRKPKGSKPTGNGPLDWVEKGRKNSGPTFDILAYEAVRRWGSKALEWGGKGARFSLPFIAGSVGYEALNAVPHGTMESATKGNPDLLPALDRENALWRGVAFEGGRHRAGLGAGPQPGDRPITLDAGTIGQLLGPTRGVSDVRVTNKQAPEFRQTNNFYITEAASAKDTAAAVMSDIGGVVKNAVEAADTD